jgi:hypothetical protein
MAKKAPLKAFLKHQQKEMKRVGPKEKAQERAETKMVKAAVAKKSGRGR